MPFPHEAIRGSDFFSAQVDAFPYHKWPKATSDREMHQRVLRKSWTRELPHVEKPFSNVAINKLVKSFKNMVFWLETSVLHYNMQSRNQNHFLPHGKKPFLHLDLAWKVILQLKKVSQLCLALPPIFSMIHILRYWTFCRG